MPFDLWLSRDRSFAGPDVVAERPIDMDRLEQLFGDAPARRRPDGSWWVRRPDTDEPWFAAHPEGGHLRLSCSYSNHRFVANFADLWDQAFVLGGPLGCMVHDEVQGRRVSRRELDQLLAADGSYVAREVEAFRDAQQVMDRGSGPLEWPLGPIDMVPEYCAFRLEGVATAPPGAAAALFGATVEPHPQGPILLVDGVPSVRLVEGAGEDLRVVPLHGHLSFADAAVPALAVARWIAGDAGARLLLGDHELVGSVEAEVRSLVQGLGVDLYEWAAAA